MCASPKLDLEISGKITTATPWKIRHREYQPDQTVQPDGCKLTSVACDSPILIHGKICHRKTESRKGISTDRPLCPHYRPVQLQLSTRLSAGASPRSPAPELLGT